MSEVRAVITKYDAVARWYFNPTDANRIYFKMMNITGNDHEISADAENWCQLATVGDKYEFREGYIKIEEV